MQYPIFQSVVNIIKDSLNDKKVPVNKFKTWEESQINATGLEIWIDLSESTNHLEAISVNFDWDRFKETKLAQQLEGTEKHPLLKSPHLKEVSISPVIDIEVTWHFDVEKCQPQITNGDSNYRINTASKWMSEASKKVNELLQSDNIITRWHLEIEGDEEGKVLTAIDLISYFQYSLEEMNSINNVHKFIERKFQHLLYKMKRVVSITDNSVEVSAA
ncbi:MAG: hypothetical protein WD599_02035 [Balneolaceae bacterium]